MASTDASKAFYTKFYKDSTLYGVLITIDTGSRRDL